MKKKQGKKKVVVIEKCKGKPDKVKVVQQGQPEPTISQVSQQVPGKQPKFQGQPVRISPKWQKLQ